MLIAVQEGLFFLKFIFVSFSGSIHRMQHATNIDQNLNSFFCALLSHALNHVFVFVCCYFFEMTRKHIHVQKRQDK